MLTTSLFSLREIYKESFVSPHFEMAKTPLLEQMVEYVLKTKVMNKAKRQLDRRKQMRDKEALEISVSVSDCCDVRASTSNI